MSALIWLVALAAAVFVAVGYAATQRARAGVAVTCPDNGQRVKVRLNPRRAVRALFLDSGQEVVDCDRWPEKAGCDRACEKHIGP